MTEPVIETSTRMVFAPFSGGYPEQAQVSTHERFQTLGGEADESYYRLI